MQQLEESLATEHLRGWRARWVLAIAFGVVIAAMGAATLLFAGRDGEDAANRLERVDAAVAATQQFLESVNAGDVETLIAMSNPETTNLVKDRRMWAMNAVLTTSGYEYVVGDCRSNIEANDYVVVHCNVTVTDPVFVAEGLSDLLFPMRVYDDGTTAWQPFQGGDFSRANRTRAEYLQAFHREEYDLACSPAAYEVGEVHADGGLALSAECADLFVPLSEEVASWVRSGKPQP